MSIEVRENTILEKNRSAIAMMVAYVSWAMLFATLFLGYTVYRFSTTTWPPNGFEKLSLLWPIISTLCIAFSSFCFYEARVNYIKRKREFFIYWLVATFIMGLAFIASQFVVWNKLSIMGLYASAGIFPSILHAFTWIHAAHILCALIAIIFLFGQGQRQRFKKNKMITVKNVENFWHFLGVIWLIMFIFLFVV